MHRVHAVGIYLYNLNIVECGVIHKIITEVQFNVESVFSKIEYN